MRRQFIMIGFTALILVGCGRSDEVLHSPGAEVRAALSDVDFFVAPDMGGLWQQVTASYQAEKWDIHYLALSEYARRRPFNQAIQRNLAKAAFELGYEDAAIEHLELIADWGLTEDLTDREGYEFVRELEGGPDLIAILSANREASGTSDVVFEIPVEGSIPEGLAYDPESGVYYISSVKNGDVYIRNPDGSFNGLLLSPEATFGYFGMDVLDGRIAISAAQMPFLSTGVENEFTQASWILLIDLNEHEHIIGNLPVLNDKARQIGEVVFDQDGNILATDSLNPDLFRYSEDKGLEVITLGTSDDFPNPQGLTVMEDGRVYMADYHKGLFLLASDGDEPAPVRLTANSAINLGGIDGLYEYEGDLIAIQNGTSPQRIIRLKLDKSGRGIQSLSVLAQNLPEWDEPTLGAIVGDELHYIATSQWGVHDGQGGIIEDAELLPIRVMSVSLAKSK